MNQHEKQQGLADAARARAELYDTLGLLRDRLNYAQRVDDAVARTKLRIAEQRRDNPAGFVAGAAAVAVLAGAAVWGIASAVGRRFK